jgi:hypothetical protein
MASRAVTNDPEPSPQIPACPICEGQMDTVYDRYHQKVAVCSDCHAGLTVPGSAWEVARIKRDVKAKKLSGVSSPAVSSPFSAEPTPS